MCPFCYQKGGSLLHCPSTLTGIFRRYISVALSLESPPPDVIWHSALQSPDFPHLTPFGFVSRDYLFYLLRTAYSIIRAVKMQTNLHIKASISYKFPQNRIARNTFTWHSQKIIQKFQQTFCFCVFRFFLCNRKQQWFCIKF